jgi:hypothetical protein
MKATNTQRLGSAQFANEEIIRLSKAIIEGTVTNPETIKLYRDNMSHLVSHAGGYTKLSEEARKAWSDQVLPPSCRSTSNAHQKHIESTLPKRKISLPSPKKEEDLPLHPLGQNLADALKAYDEEQKEIKAYDEEQEAIRIQNVLRNVTSLVNGTPVDPKKDPAEAARLALEALEDQQG